ncbi:UDP-glycosyltransferase 74F1 [Dendrobium catenatum]|uniref:Glycosyltransferase n=1 Tax=Dendrobium catenatum TaxID=906689 RepID=A0A2I0W0Z9_9ASPA|nr:UDP-glycosyltransferase 74F1 [Dendrobium catenatum]
MLFSYHTQAKATSTQCFNLASASRHGRLATAAITRFIASTTTHNAGPVAHRNISDGFDEAGFPSAASISAYLTSLETIGSQTLDDLLSSLAHRGRPVSLLIYDSFFPWAVDVAKRHGAAAASFFTQSVAVDVIYCHVCEGRLKFPAAAVKLPGLPEMEVEDLPTYLAAPEVVYVAYLEMVLNQYKNLEKADIMVINSFYELESEEMNWLTSVRRAITIGPTVPSTYLDNRIPDDQKYAIDLYPPETSACKSWISSLPLSSAIFVSVGSMAVLSATQMVELAVGLAATDRPFLWVVRATEADKLPAGFAETTKKNGSLVVSWAPQLEILATGKFGCFVTHCGWNSTMEALALGVPMVALPQWTDQTTDAKYIEEVWGTGIRARKGEEGIVRREEVERCVREVMEGERSEGIRRSAREWKEASRRAVDAGGSSDRNIAELLDKFC